MSRYGLIEVYKPADRASQIAHVVFVHGLFGHPQKTWSGKRSPTADSTRATDQQRDRQEQGNENSRAATAGSAISPQSFRSEPGSVFWPQVLLPSIIPDADIYTWGYDADVDKFGSASQNTIHQHATSLLSDLADLQESLGSQSTPIIFVVHSLGGIIVKDALNQSSQTEGTRLKSVAPATYGVCFLGTPHRGSKSASLGKIAYQITVAATRRPNLRLLHSLERNSETLDRVGSSFSQTLLKHKLQICSFREEKETRKFWVFNTIVVDPDSAKIGEGTEETGSLPYNHSGMTKFATTSDIGFKRVSARIKRWVDESRGTQNMHMSKGYRYCIASLDNPEARLRLQNVAKSYKDTFQWLFDRDRVEFLSWLENSKNKSLLWICGKPGSGKSTLMKFAMRDRRTLEALRHSGRLPWIIVGFFFYDRGNAKQKTFLAMLQEILYQLLFQAEQLTSFIYSFYTDLAKRQRTTSPSWDIETLQNALLAIAHQNQTIVHACLFLDALDEHDGDNEQLAKFLYELTSTTGNTKTVLKICVASRSWPIFETYFGRCPGFAIHDFTQSDIRDYTVNRLYENSPKAKISSEDATHREKVEKLADQVTEKASGVIIWVRLVLDELAIGIRDGTPIAALQEKVSAMPQELRDLYAYTLKRINPEYAQEAYVMLQIALYSISPLSLDTFFDCTTYALLWQTRLKYRSGAPLANAPTPEPMNMMKIDGIGIEHYINIEHTRQYIEIIPSESGNRGSDTASQAEMNNQLPIVEFAQYQSTEEMTRRLASRSGGLLEVVSLRNSDSTKLGVQFFHQTVKEFMRETKHNILPLTYLRPECGLLYLLRYAMMFQHPFADSVTQDMFEYANLLVQEDTVSSKSKLDLFHLMKRTCEANNSRYLEWFLRQHRFKFYKDFLLEHEIPPSIQLRCVFISANLLNHEGLEFLFSYSPSWADHHNLLRSVTFRYLFMAALGPRIVSGEHKLPRTMENLLMYFNETKSRITDVQTSDVIEERLELFEWTLKRQINGRAIGISEDDQVSILKIMQRYGLLQNLLFKDMVRVTISRYCVGYSSERIIRLLIEIWGVEIFLKDGSDSLILESIHLAPLRGHVGILRALQEPGKVPKWNAESLDDRSALQALCHMSLLGAGICQSLARQEGT